MNAFILPTQGSTAYRGRYPFRARSVSFSAASGQHIELNNGTRLWSLSGTHVRLRDDMSALLAKAVPMTAEQYATLQSAAELLRTRSQIAGHGRRAELEARVESILLTIKPGGANYAKRNAEAARRDCLAATAAGERHGFNPERPFRVRNRTPQFSGSFDFATLEEARAYLSAQLARRDCVVSGAAPVGPDSNSQDPLQSFIIWPDGTETLADSPWNWTEYAPGSGSYRWNPPAVASCDTREGTPGCLCPKCNPAGGRADELRRNWDPENGTRADRERHVAETLEAEAAERLERPLRLSEARRGNMGSNCPDCGAETHGADGCPGPVRKAETISLEMNWRAAAGIIRTALEAGTGEGRRMARLELDRMAELADGRNALARVLSSLLAEVVETRHCVPGMAGEALEAAMLAGFAALDAGNVPERDPLKDSGALASYAMRGDGIQAAGAIVLRQLPDGSGSPFVVHFRNDDDSRRIGRPAYTGGDYCETLAEAWQAFADKIRRYDPAGTLAA
jgi:hypothetical protein